MPLDQYPTPSHLKLIVGCDHRDEKLIERTELLIDSLLNFRNILLYILELPRIRALALKEMSAHDSLP